MDLGHAVHGHGDTPVLILHEWLGDHANWASAIPYLDAQRNTYVIADLRGYGRSRDIAGRYTLEEAADDVLRLMTKLGHDKFYVVAHSMSGLVGQWLAVRWPMRVLGLFAISPVPPGGFKVDSATLERMQCVISDDDAAVAAIMARTGQRYGRGWLTRKLAIARAAAHPAAMEGYLRMFTTTDITIQAVGCPVRLTILAGLHDIAPYQASAVESSFDGVYPNLEVHICSEAGHYAMLEAPPFTASAIDRFLNA